MQTEKQRSGREDQIKAMIVHELRNAEKLLHGHKVFLYGSRAQGTARIHSDFDLGIWGKEPLPSKNHCGNWKEHLLSQPTTTLSRLDAYSTLSFVLSWLGKLYKQKHEAKGLPIVFRQDHVYGRHLLTTG